MKSIILILILLFSFNIYAGAEPRILKVSRDGLIVVVEDFKEGDKIKLFEVESGDHVLSKTRGQVDLSFLPMGRYLLENSKGFSIIIEKTDTELVLEKELGVDYMVSEPIDLDVARNITIEEEIEEFYIANDASILKIERDGDLVKVLDFEEGDKIKLFEVKNKIHVLSKTVGIVDLSQLPAGKYFLRDNHGKQAVVEKE